jgi:hypothetical protein
VKVTTNAGVFNRIGRSFEYLGAYMDRQGSIDMQNAMAEKILKKAQQLVPVRTGALRASGRVARSQDRKGVEVRFGNSRIRYALVVEFGRVSFAPFPPKPYIRPAVRYASRHFQRDAKLVLDRAVAKSLPRFIT